MLTFGTLPESGIVEVKLDGRADKKELAALREECEQISRERGSVKMLFVFERLGGVSPGALIEDLKLEADLFSDLTKLAIVTDKDWYKTLTEVTTKLFSFEVRTFEIGERGAALDWLKV